MTGDIETVSLLVGVAAAVVGAAYILLRRGRTVELPTRRFLSPSEDFKAICAVAVAPGPAAEIAARVREAPTVDPSTWTVSELPALSDSERRTLFEAFAALSTCSVTSICPAAGDVFDADRMEPATRVTMDDRWVVYRDTPATGVGFSLSEKVQIKANVELCTADWWVLSSHMCPVGKVIAEDPAAWILGGTSAAPRWRAPWGLAHPEDLRARFDERTLDAWRQRMVADLNPLYADRTERRLSLTGAVDEVFDTSIMECAGEAPLGDAVVTAIVSRDETPQRGLACAGGSALLLAVVEAVPARIGSL